MSAEIKSSGSAVILSDRPSACADIPNVGPLAYFLDPEANVFGVMELER